MGPNLGGGWDTTDWGTLDYYRPGGTYGDIGDFFPTNFYRKLASPNYVFREAIVLKCPL